ncbi:hypothetical protein ACJ2A9_06045 [Anaerobacillus sp. MEB173]|uniref:hypothetical protein n=1 Tax=Anaerobacillus sp. MEB173 TaxID=3383345 RepID=UPI003F927685
MFWFNFIQIALFFLLVVILYPLFKILKTSNPKNNIVPSKRVVLIVTTSSLIFLLIGIICIYNFANRVDRPMFILLLGAIIMAFQQVILRVIENKMKNPS